MCEIIKTWVLGESLSGFEWLEEVLGFKGPVKKCKPTEVSKVIGVSYGGDKKSGLYSPGTE